METKVISSFAYLSLVLMASLGIKIVASSALNPIPTTTLASATLTGTNKHYTHTIEDGAALISVPTTSGVLQGTKQNISIANNSVYKFLSVPYAEAPIGSLRFKRPVEVKPDRSSSVIDASKFTKTCPQYRHLTQFISPLLNIDNEHGISEDCLHLHIYVPSTVGSADSNNRLEPIKQLPVIVWIPGEGFDFADARQFDGSYLAHKTQSIVVSVQYRVGVLGFLYAPKMNIMGNMGLYDQIMALKWIKQNIQSFGGDSDRVTLMGRFSGSMSISAIVTAPRQDLIKLNGQPLFNRIAMLSGVAINDWIIDGHQEDRLRGLEKGAVLKGYCTNNQVNDNTCLEQISTENLLRISDYGWRLVVDDELIGQVSPIDAIKMNQINPDLEAVLIGETGMEGTLCLYRHMLDTRNNYAQLIEEEKLTKKILHEIIKDDSKTYFEYNGNNNKTNPILNTLKSMNENYNNNNIYQRNLASSSNHLRDEYLDACSSYMIKSHSNRFKRNVVVRNNLAENRMDASKKPIEVYHYELKYKPTFSLAPEYIKTAAHGDDIPLIFGLVYSQPRRSVNAADLLMTRKMMSYIGNFIHGNNPLLNQQDSISKNVVDNDNEAAAPATTTTTSMDEDESNISTEYSSNSQIQGTSLKTSWSNEGQIHTIDLTKNDLNELSLRKSQNLNSNPFDGLLETINNSNEISASPDSQKIDQVPRIYLRGDRSNIKILVFESLQADSRTHHPIIDVIERKNHQRQQPQPQQLENGGEILSQQQNEYNEQGTSKSPRMLELHRQQMVDDNIWMQNSRKHPLMSAMSNQQLQQQQVSAQPTTMTLVNDSSFMTILVFSSCVVIFTLMSLCLGLCLVIFRSNLTANKGIQHYASASSSCNICDDSQGGSIDAVLNGHRKDGSRGFGNVFEKLRSHNTSSQTTTATTLTNHSPQSNIQCTSNHTNQRAGNQKNDMVALSNQQQLVDNGNAVIKTNSQQLQQGSC